MYRAQEPHDSAWNFDGGHAAVQTIEQPCEENGENVDSSQKRKFYGLCMIPYPSGDGLHVGHLLGYTVLDVICRYKRMKGYQVLNPIGWDSFGLPAERYAESVNMDVKEVTRDNIENFKRQLKCMGFSYDWSREIATSDPSYYKWTQWIFQQFYKQGVAYRAKETVNWCPELNSVLANEEVKNGRSERGGFNVYRKPMEQWLLRITQYAQRLSDDLDDLEWPKSIKYAQKKWIGLERGYKVTFKYADNTGSRDELYGFTSDIEELRNVERIEVSTDMNHLSDLVDPAAKAQVNQLVEDAAKMSNLERYDNKQIVDTGKSVINPLTGGTIKVYVTNTPLLFSKPINCRVVTSAITQNNNQQNPCKGNEKQHSECISSVSNTKNCGNYTDATDDGNHLCHEEKDICANCIEPFLNVKLKDWVFSRQRYWGEPIPLKSDGNSYTLVQENMLPMETGAKHVETMPQWAGSSWHFLRFCDPANDKRVFDLEKANFWMPVDIYVGGAEHSISHLLYARFWNKVLYDMGISPVSEPFKKIMLHGMIRSAYFYLDGKALDPQLVTKYKGKYVLKSDLNTVVDYKLEKMSKSKGNVVSPDVLIEKYGADALRLHLLFLGPVEKDKIWSDRGLIGVSKLLNRIDAFFRNVTIVAKDQPVSDRLKVLVNKITKDIENDCFNVAISDFFSFLPVLSKLPISGKLGRNVANIFLKLLAPFAPHMAEHLWHMVNPGDVGSISNTAWPI